MGASAVRVDDVLHALSSGGEGGERRDLDGNPLTGPIPEESLRQKLRHAEGGEEHPQLQELCYGMFFVKPNYFRTFHTGSNGTGLVEWWDGLW